MEKYVEVKAVQEFAGTFLGDPILKMAVNAVLDHAPAVDLPKLTSAEKQATFRLGQMDMKESIVAILQGTAEFTSGITRAALLAAVDLIKDQEVP